MFPRDYFTPDYWPTDYYERPPYAVSAVDTVGATEGTALGATGGTVAATGGWTFLASAGGWTGDVFGDSSIYAFWNSGSPSYWNVGGGPVTDDHPTIGINLTWETIGVPHGATVVSARFTIQENLTYSAGIGLPAYISDYQIAGPSSSILDFGGRSTTASDGAPAIFDSGVVAVPSAMSASDAALTLGGQYTLPAYTTTDNKINYAVLIAYYSGGGGGGGGVVTATIVLTEDAQRVLDGPAAVALGAAETAALVDPTTTTTTLVAAGGVETPGVVESRPMVGLAAGLPWAWLEGTPRLGIGAGETIVAAQADGVGVTVGAGDRGLATAAPFVASTVLTTEAGAWLEATPTIAPGSTAATDRAFVASLAALAAAVSGPDRALWVESRATIVLDAKATDRIWAADSGYAVARLAGTLALFLSDGALQLAAAVGGPDRASMGERFGVAAFAQAPGDGAAWDSAGAVGLGARDGMLAIDAPSVAGTVAGRDGWHTAEARAASVTAALTTFLVIDAAAWVEVGAVALGARDDATTATRPSVLGSPRGAEVVRVREATPTVGPMGSDSAAVDSTVGVGIMQGDFVSFDARTSVRAATTATERAAWQESHPLIVLIGVGTDFATIGENFLVLTRHSAPDQWSGTDFAALAARAAAVDRMTTVERMATLAALAAAETLRTRDGAFVAAAFSRGDAAGVDDAGALGVGSADGAALADGPASVAPTAVDRIRAADPAALRALAGAGDAAAWRETAAAAARLLGSESVAVIDSPRVAVSLGVMDRLRVVATGTAGVAVGASDAATAADAGASQVVVVGAFFRPGQPQRVGVRGVDRA